MKPISLNLMLHKSINGKDLIFLSNWYGIL